MIKHSVIFAGLLMTIQNPAFANDTVDTLLKNYQQQGAGKFSIEAGETLWNKEVTHSKLPATRSCASCHGPVLTNAGQHLKTKKVIKPMSPIANPDRFTDEEKVEKWFFRNCKWTWGRECNVQEKGDILLFLSKQ